ncbi:hypothetical protein ACHQM5_006515 [Ranunculus cassubicifolius]
MFGFKISPLKERFLSSNFNPFDSYDESDSKNNTPIGICNRSTSEPILVDSKCSTNPFDDDEGRDDVPSSSSSYSGNTQRKKYNSDFRDSGGLENQSVQELEDYVVYKAEETTKAFSNCLRVAVDIREDASKTLVMLHHQGDQMMRTHGNAADIERDLSRGEKLLGSLGGMFSKTWKPKRTRSITGPVYSRDDPIKSRANHLEQKQRLGLLSSSNGQSRPEQRTFEPTSKLQTVEAEKMKQDDALNDVSNILEELKAMAIDMGSEIERQNKALDHFNDDVEELNVRVRHANGRARRLLGK